MDQFLIDEFENSKLGRLAAVARIHNAADWPFRLRMGGLMDKDHSGLDLLCDTTTSLDIF